MNTRIYKDNNKNWRAETNIDISNDRVISITTSKTMTGSLNTNVSVSERVAGFLKHIRFVDYNKIYNFSIPVRITEKVVSVQHNETLNIIDDIINDVVKFYEELDSNKA